MSQLWRSVIGEVGIFLPVGLHEDAVDDVDINGAGGGTDGFDEAADAEVAGLAQDAVGGADDEVDGRRREGVVAEAGVVEFAEDELAQGVGRQPLGDRRVGHPAFDVVVDAEVEVGEQAGAADEDEVMIFGEVSRMVVRALPAWLSANACSMSLRSQWNAELWNSMRKASQRILTVLV